MIGYLESHSADVGPFLSCSSNIGPTATSAIQSCLVAECPAMIAGGHLALGAKNYDGFYKFNARASGAYPKGFDVVPFPADETSKSRYLCESKSGYGYRPVLLLSNFAQPMKRLAPIGALTGNGLRR